MKNKFLCIVICILLIFAMLPTVIYAMPLTSWTDENNYDISWYNASANSFNIDTAAKLAGLAYLVNNGNTFTGKTIKLVTNIDLSKFSWDPIGNLERYFNGVFDGQGFYISGLNINIVGNDLVRVGLFGYIGVSGTVKNLTLYGNINVNNCVEAHVGGIAGVNTGSIVDSVNNCNISAVRSSKGNFIGGIVGNSHTGSVSNSKNNGNISSSSSDIDIVGGIAGYNNIAKISLCSNNGNIISSSNRYITVAGVVGMNKGTLLDNNNEGSIAAFGGDLSIVGGVVGRNEASISGCNNYSLVSSNKSNISQVGGVVGYNEGDITECQNISSIIVAEATDIFVGGITGNNKSKITGSYNTGDVKVNYSKKAYIGGIAGCSEGFLVRCYNTGNLNGISELVTYDIIDSFIYAGGVVGLNKNSVDSCYNSGNTYAEGNSANVIGGLVGMQNKGTVRESINKGDLEVKASRLNTSGGVVGSNEMGTIINCSNEGTVSATKGHVNSAGGVVGTNSQAVINCFNTGNVIVTGEMNSKGNMAGGVVAYNMANVPSVIENCYNSGDVKASGSLALSGGIAGSNSNLITNCYNVGSISAEGTSARKGSIVGSNNKEVTNSYYLEGTPFDGISESGAKTSNIKAFTAQQGKGLDAQLSYSINQNTVAGTLSDALNSWVNNEPKNKGYNNWLLDKNVNDGYPIFGQQGSQLYVPGANMPFADISKGAWYFEDVIYAYENSLFSGSTATLFSPNTAVTRSMLVTALWRLDGSPQPISKNNFHDVTMDMWYTEAVAWAAENELVLGYNGYQFGPNDKVTREQMATILHRYARYKGYSVAVGGTSTITSYSDVSSVSAYAIEALRWTNYVGIIQGSAGKLIPKGDATRAQVSAILHRFDLNIVN